MHSQIVNEYSDGRIANGDAILNFLDENFLFMRYGYYETKLSYHLPGGIQGTSAVYRFKNPIKSRE
jgi:hypothetical protein